MLKYIKMTASSNFGNVFSVLVASAFMPFLPMLPMQLLVQNLLYDISQIAIPFDNVDEELLQAAAALEARRHRPLHGLLRADQLDLRHHSPSAVMWFVFAANTVAKQTLFQSGWFVVGLLTQTLIVHMIRTPKIPFIQSRAADPAVGDDRSHHGHRHLPADGAAGALLQAAAAAAAYFVLSAGDPARLHGTDAGDEGVLQPRFGWQ